MIVLGHLDRGHQRRAYPASRTTKLNRTRIWGRALLSAELQGLLAEDLRSVAGRASPTAKLNKLLALDPDGRRWKNGGAGDSVPPVTIPEPTAENPARARVIYGSSGSPGCSAATARTIRECPPPK